MNAYRKKTVSAVLAALLLAVGATACQSGDDAKKDKGAPAPAKAAEKPAEVTPAAYLEKTKKKSEEISSLRYSIVGDVAGQKVTGEAAVRMKPTVAMSMRMDSPEKPGEKVEIRLLDSTMYLGAQSKWLKFDLKALAPDQAKQLDSLGAAQQGQNPADTADSLGSAKDLTKVGEETVDGQKTTHLTGTVSVDELRSRNAAASSPEAKERQGKNLAALEAQGIKSLTMDIWIDENDQPKQVRTRGAGTSGPMDVTVKFLDINKPVEVAAPPAEQVIDLAEMMKEEGGGSA
ncbi:LppX_LprAFG lipoprotein [Streptomyces sp. NPDC047014]|uniref:LppX_LprAFG lipoprotein n=1 Tax=Streptomyces sp. NPDC047014 TaxID=3155736 RepID=UPI0033F7AB47